MKILHVVPSYFPATRYGGPIRSVHSLCKNLINRGHWVEVFTTNVNGNEDLDVPVNRPVNINGVSVQYFSSKLIRRLYRSPDMARQLKSRINEFDIVHIHSVYLWPTLVSARIAKNNSIPYLLAPRGMLVKSLIKRKNRIIKSLWIRFFEKKTIFNAAGLHVTSFVEAQEIQKFDLNLPEIFCVPNGIDLNQIIPFDDSNLINSCPEKFVLFLGRINWEKGLDRLIRSFKYVQDIKLVIAGNDEENYQQELKLIAVKENILERIYFIDSITDENKWSLYRKAELLVLPSYSENFGNVVLEAMAVGCPVVTTPEVGLSLEVSKNETGIVIEGVPKLLGQAIQVLLDDKELRNKMGLRGKQLIENKYTWPLIAKQMEDVYQKIVYKYN